MEAYSSPPRSRESEGKRAEKKITPKFASFKPKNASFQSSGTEYINESKKHSWSRQSNDRSRFWSSEELKEERDHDFHKPIQGSHQERLQGAVSRSPRPSDPVATFLGDRSDFYVIDKNGDPNNLKFGSLDRYRVPRYSRWGAGNLIGLSRRHKIDRSISHDQAIVIVSQDQIPHHLDSYSVLRTLKPLRGRELKIKARASEENAVEKSDYVFLEKSKPIKRQEDREPSVGSLSSGDEYNDFRFIKQISELHNSSTDEGLQYLEGQSESQAQVANKSKDLVYRQAEFNRSVELDPTDVEAWLSLILVQEKVVDPGDGNTKRTVAEKKSIADVRISMYEKALSHVQVPSARERLLIGMMQEAAISWDTATLSAKWRYLLQTHPTYLNLLIQHLNFRQSDYFSFTYDAVRKQYLSCLEGLTQSLRKLPYGTEEHIGLCKMYIHVFLRLTLVAREAGFTEYATAAWQAILELHFFRPPSFHQYGGSNVEKDLLAAFEKFWDSEVPRIGEYEARGWLHSDTARHTATKARVRNAGNRSDKQDKTDHWLALEQHHSRMSHDVARTTDEFEVDDPYKVILYDDLEPLLFVSLSPESWKTLIDAFLTFCQLPTLQASPIFHLNSWWSHGLVHNSVTSQSNVGMDQFDTYAQFYQIDQDTMFSRAGDWFLAFSRYGNLCRNKNIEIGWTLGTLRDLTKIGAGADVFAEYYLAFELAVSQDTARKTAKRLLKRFPSSLRLYNAFAILECRLGDIRKLENVIVTTLKMSKQLDSLTRRDTILLWRTLVWELVKLGHHAAAFARLVVFPDETELQDLVEADANKRPTPQAALILHAERSFSAERDRHLSHNMPQLAIAAVHCLFLLAYLSDPSTLVAAHTAFRSNIEAFSRLPSHGASQERLHQCFAHLIYNHTMRTNQFKPSEIRSYLADSIATFPHNTIFLSMYASNEARFHIEDRVRSVVRDVLSTASSKSSDKDNLIPYFFAIHIELARGVHFGSNTNAIRGAFERAVENDAAAHCPGLWKMYFMFEHFRGNMHEAKSVFYRSIRACPWVKDLYLLAFEHLKGGEKGMSETELMGLYDLMNEKELRLHVDLHELMESEK